VIEVKTYWNGELQSEAEGDDMEHALFIGDTFWDDTYRFRGGALCHTTTTTFKDLETDLIVKRIEGRRPSCAR
jgi:hypothetical protein